MYPKPYSIYLRGTVLYSTCNPPGPSAYLAQDTCGVSCATGYHLTGNAGFGRIRVQWFSGLGALGAGV